MYTYLLIVGIIVTLVAMIIVEKVKPNPWWSFGWILPVVLITLFGATIVARPKAPPAPVYSETIAVSYRAILKQDGRLYNEEVSVDSKGGNARVLKTHFVGTDTILFTVLIDGKKRLYEAQNPEAFIAACRSKKGPNSTCGKPRYKVGENGCKLSELFVAIPVMDTVLLRELNFDSVPLARHR